MKELCHKICFLFCIVLVLSSCTGTGGPATPTIVDYHKGTDGLVIKFTENLPPSEIIQGSDFIIGLELSNKGAFPITDGEISIYGFNQRRFSLPLTKATFSLEGRSPAFTEGEYTVQSFKAKNIDIPVGSKKYDDSFIARAYYEYQTEATAEVCINPAIYSFEKTKDSVCEIKPISLSGGQGAPIAVTKVETIPSISGESSISAIFKITIANKGKGKPVKDIVNIREVFLGAKKLQCSKDYLELKKNEEDNVFSCSAVVESPRGAFLSPLKIKLSYVYQEDVNKKVTVKPLA